MKYILKISIVVWILLIGGCSTNNTDNYPEWDKSNLPPENVLEIHLDAPSTSTSGEPILLKMEVKNVSGTDLFLGVLNNPLSVSKNNTGVYDFMFTDSEGNLYWSKFYNQFIPDLPASVSLSAGATIVLEHEWNGKDIHGQTFNPGRYQITGYYTIGSISNKTDGLDVQENEVGFYTTQPHEIIVQ